MVGIGMDTASLKAKLFQHLASLKEEVLYYVFLDLRKVYDDMYHKCCLEILVVYGVRPQINILLRT